VFGHGESGTAAISSIVVQVHTQQREERICFAGPVNFVAKTARHIKEVVLPAADKIINLLELPKHSFDICVSNLGAASLNDIGLTISGFSADVPVLLAILSATLQIPIPDDIVSTGHIASSDGDIRMVRRMPAKVTAVEKAKSIRTFVHPEVNKDTSLDSYTPIEKEKIINALIKARNVIRTIGVRDMGDLVRAVFPEEKVILAGLKMGFFNSPISFPSMGTVAGRAVAFFAGNSEKRFWKVIERQLIEGKSDDAKEALLAFVNYHIDQQIYPDKMGTRLFNLVQSLPPDTRRKKIVFPLIPVSKCIQLGQFAHETEFEDVLIIFKTIQWDKTQQLPMVDVAPKGSDIAHPLQGRDQLQSILSEIDADALTTLISLPIDNARATYVMESVLVDSKDQFNDIIASFYLHLLRHTRRLFEPVDLKAAGAEGFKLLENAFSKKGGYKGALAEARNGPNGGLRLVLDMMTEQLKREKQQEHVEFVLKAEIEGLDWESKVTLLEALFNQIKDHLPPEIRSQPPESYAKHSDIIVKAYVNSMDQLRFVFRSI
jgi:hypothetical protein